MMEILKTIVKSINMSERKEEDPNSGFSKERFLRAVNASKIKLNQVIQHRQEREAKINNASNTVANKAFEDEKLIKEKKIYWTVHQFQRI